MATARTPIEILTTHIAEKAKSAGLSWDTYDSDFLLGVVMEWLSEHKAVLTNNGVEKEEICTWSS